MTTRTSRSPVRRAGVSRLRAKHVQTVRALIAQVRWLDGRLYWRDGRVVWTGAGGDCAPGPSELALAQRRLTQIARYPGGADQVLGDHRVWLRVRYERLSLAKRLSSLSAPDLKTVARQALARDEAALRELAGMLAAEALCLNDLPVSPSAALLAAGDRAEAPLTEVLLDDDSPPAVAALAAMTLGAVHAAGSPRFPPAPVVTQTGLRRPYDWGRRAGLPRSPGLAIAVLAGENGPDLTRRLLRARSGMGHFQPDAALLREALEARVPAARVVALAEAAADAEPLAARILKSGPSSTSDCCWICRRAEAESGRERTGRSLRRAAEVAHAYVRTSAEPDTLRLVARFFHAMLDLGIDQHEAIEAALTALEGGLPLPVELQRPYVQLLADHVGVFWPCAEAPTGRQRTRRAGGRHAACTRRCRCAPPEMQGAALRGWLETRQAVAVEPLLALLHATTDPEAVAEAVARGIHRTLAGFLWKEPGLCRWLLELERVFNPNGVQSVTYTLARTLSGFGSLCQARAALQPLADALIDAPVERRGLLLARLIDGARGTFLPLTDVLPRLTRYAPEFIEHVRQAGHDDDWTVSALIRGLLALDGTARDRARLRLASQLSRLRARGRKNETLAYDAIQTGSLLAATLAREDDACFERIFDAAIRLPYRSDWDELQRGVALLDRLTGVRVPLARLFDRQPHRCATLLARLGLAARLGPTTSAYLQPLETESGPSYIPPPPEWDAVLLAAPELFGAIDAYRRARRIGGDDAGLPAGLRHALEMPARLERELANLERLTGEQRRRDGLDARISMLRARLADGAGLQETIRRELRERLPAIADEAQLLAAERCVLACFRGRLAAACGPLPADLPLDDDLLNAALLLAEIGDNRRLLARLLRAQLAGDDRWRERHPANAAFLRWLAKRGVDTAAWLGSHPRVYKHARFAAGRVRIHLERRPLRILQMGNHVNTCLSVGGINAHATVANACELNKRVIYATDGKGQVVGRKLIGVTDDGTLAGFWTYVTRGDKEGGNALRALIRRYAAGFAAHCGLTLSDTGTIPTLFAPAWYDDGVVPWENAPARPSKTQSNAGGAARRRAMNMPYPPRPSSTSVRHTWILVR